MHPKNTTVPPKAQVMLTTAAHFCETPIENRGDQIMQVMAGINAQDALQTARMLSSGLGQICRHVHDSLNAGEMAFCDGLATMQFVAETVSALVCAVQKGQVGEARP